MNLQERYGKDTLWWDLGTSPVLAGDRAIVAVMHEGESYLVAFDLVERRSRLENDRRVRQPRSESDQAYTTPQVVKIDGKDVIVTWGADHLTGHDAATGKLLWECGGFNPDNEGMWRVIASAAIDDGMAIVPYGRGEFLAGVRLGGKGDVTKSNRVWDKGQASGRRADGRRARRQGVLADRSRARSCASTSKSGDELWSAELAAKPQQVLCVAGAGGDKLYCAREDGMVFVGRVSDDGFERWLRTTWASGSSPRRCRSAAAC